MHITWNFSYIDGNFRKFATENDAEEFIYTEYPGRGNRMWPNRLPNAITLLVYLFTFAFNTILPPNRCTSSIIKFLTFLKYWMQGENYYWERWKYWIGLRMIFQPLWERAKEKDRTFILTYSIFSTCHLKIMGKTEKDWKTVVIFPLTESLTG